MVPADEAAHVGQDVHPGARGHGDAQLARLGIDPVARGGNERRAPELAHRQADQQVVHRRVPGDHDIDDVRGGRTDRVRQVVRQRVDRRERGLA